MRLDFLGAQSGITMRTEDYSNRNNQPGQRPCDGPFRDSIHHLSPSKHGRAVQSTPDSLTVLIFRLPKVLPFTLHNAVEGEKVSVCSYGLTHLGPEGLQAEGTIEYMDHWVIAPLLFVAGLVAGTLNVIAGGGSLLTLPLMIFLGLPATVANGTNRVALLAQNVGAVWSFHRHGIIDWGWIRLAAIPGLLGAGLGTWLALIVDDAAFQRLLAVLLVAVALWTMWNPLSDRKVGETIEGADRPGRRVLLGLVFFGIGIYGGFIQAGIGFIILAVTTLAELDLVRGNALKVLFVLFFTPVSLALFAAGGKVDWAYGFALAAGNLAGAFIGVRLTVLKGHAWIRQVITVTVIVFAIRLWLWG